MLLPRSIWTNFSLEGQLVAQSKEPRAVWETGLGVGLCSVVTASGTGKALG